MDLKLASGAIVAFLGFLTMPQAEAAENVRVRGTIVGLEGSTLTVKTREGPTSALALKPDWKVTGIAKASVEDIKPGDFVGIASLPAAAGGDAALEVLVFPPAMKGTGEGSYPWDLKPKSSMTNATVTNAVKDVDGRTLTLSYSAAARRKRSQSLTAPRSSPSAQRRKPTLSPARLSSFPLNAATMEVSPQAALSSAQTAPSRRCRLSSGAQAVSRPRSPA
jgi:hypothetical protein